MRFSGHKWRIGAGSVYGNVACLFMATLSVAPALSSSSAQTAVLPPGEHVVLSENLIVGDYYLRAPVPGAKSVAGYVSIHNTGKESVRLVGATAGFAERVEIHEMKMDGSVMKMRPLKDGVTVPPDKTVDLKPGAAHLMFMGPTKQIQVEEYHRVSLNFAGARTLTLKFPVKPIGYAARDRGTPEERRARVLKKPQELQNK